jgi:hypothetical protein
MVDNSFVAGLEATARAQGVRNPRVLTYPDWVLVDVETLPDGSEFLTDIHTFTSAVDIQRYIGCIASLYALRKRLEAESTAS